MTILINSAFVTDFESNEELYFEWKELYIIESYKEKRAMIVFGESKSIKKGGDCLAVTFVDDTFKFAVGTYKSAKLLKKMPTKLKISYSDGNKNNKDATIPKQIRIKNDIFPSVIKKIPMSRSIPFMLMKNEFNQSTESSNSPKLPSPSVTPESSPSSPTISPSQDTSEQLSQFNHEMLTKCLDGSDKHKLKNKRVNKLIRSTITKAKQSINPNKKTAIKYSTKFIFCLRHEKYPKMSLKSIYEQMKCEGFIVGKGSGINVWAQKGSPYWHKLMIEKGDGAKYAFIVFYCII